MISRSNKRLKPTYSKALKCAFCQKNMTTDFKESDILVRYITDRGKVFSRGRTGFCAVHQRKMAREVKKARYMGFIPYITRV